MPVATFIEYTIAFVMLYATVLFVLLTIKYKEKIGKNQRLKKGWKPKISVIIPAYNEEKYIEACIRSVLNADYPKKKLEVIIVDDGSTDRTYWIAKSIKDKRLKVYRKENSGKAASLNFGLAKASGEIIATLDADSYIEKDSIMKMLPHFDSDEVAAVTAAVKVKEDGKEGILKTIQKIEYMFVIFTRKLLSYIDAVPVTPGPLSMFRASIFKEIGGFDEKSILEDQEIALRIQSHNYKIGCSIDANVYTEIPENLPELIHQRVRWHRGGLRNTIKYLNMISPHYGDFGIMIMPFNFIAIFALLGVFVITALYYLSFGIYYQQQLGLEWLLLSLSPIHIINGFLLILNLLWISWGLTVFKKERIGTFKIFIYIIAYSYLFTIYWTATLLKELTSQKISW